MKQRGFTLIELLVVVAIIAIIVSSLVINYTSAKQKARDANRLSNIKTISNALAAYQINRGFFPTYNGYISGTDKMSQVLKDEAILKITPIDPLDKISNGINYKYSYQSTDGSNYILGFCLETDSIQGYKKGCENKIKP